MNFVYYIILVPNKSPGYMKKIPNNTLLTMFVTSGLVIP